MTLTTGHHTLDTSTEAAMADELRASLRAGVITRTDPG
jgi:hypothetical protein